MDVLINATILSENNTGLGVYAYHVLNELCPIMIHKSISFKIMCKKKSLLPPNCQCYALEVDFKNYIERNLLMNNVYKTEDYKLIWSTTQHGITKVKGKQIVTVHDIIPLLYPAGRWHQYVYYRFLLPLVMKKCCNVLVDSESTKNDLIKHYGCKAEKIVVNYAGFVKNSDYRAEQTDSVSCLTKYGLDKYFITIGIHYKYKNIHSVLKAMSCDEKLKDYKYVIIGNDSCKYGEYLKRVAEECGVSSRVVFTGFVNQEEKQCLLRQAIALVYPTLYEGFGLPILEAMQEDVPVLTSKVSSLPEVAGDAALYFDPYSVSDIADKLYEIATKELLRKELVEKGRVNLKRFSWKKSAEVVCEMFEKALI